MLISIQNLQETLKNKNLNLTQDSGNLVITDKTTNSAVFTMKLCGKAVNFKSSDLEALKNMPETKPETKKRKEKNMSETPELKPETKKVAKVKKPAKMKPLIFVEIEIEPLAKKIANINRCQGKELIKMVQTDDGLITIENKMKNTKFELTPHDNKVVINLDDYKAIRNPRAYDEETGKIIPIAQIAKANKPVRPPREPKVKKERVPKVVVPQYHTMPLEDLQKMITRINECEDTELFTITHRKEKMKITKKGEGGFSIRATSSEQVENEIKTVMVTMLLSDYRLIKHPEHFDADGKKLRLLEFLKTKPKKERVKKVKVIKEKVVEPAKPINYEPVTLKVANLYSRIVRINRIMQSKVVEFSRDGRIITIKNTLNDTRYHLVATEDNQEVTLTRPDVDGLQVKKADK